MAKPTTNSEVEEAVLNLARKPRPGDPGTPEDPLAGLQPTLDMMSGKSDARPGDPGTPQDPLRNVQPSLDQLRAKAAATGIASQKAAKEEEEVDVVDPVEEVVGAPAEPVVEAPEVAEPVEETEVVDTPETEAALEAAGVNETDSEQEVATKTDKVVGDESPVETEARRGAFGPVEGLTIPELRRQYRSERQAARGRLGDITADNAELMQERAEAIAGTKQQMRELKDAKRNVRRTLRGKGVPSQGKGNIFQSGREAAAAKALADAKALEDIKEGVEDVADSAADAAREGGAPKPKAPKSNLTDRQVEGMAGADVDEELALEQLESLPDAVIEEDEADLDKAPNESIDVPIVTEEIDRSMESDSDLTDLQDSASELATGINSRSKYDDSKQQAFITLRDRVETMINNTGSDGELDPNMSDPTARNSLASKAVAFLDFDALASSGPQETKRLIKDAIDKGRNFSGNNSPSFMAFQSNRQQLKSLGKL